MELYFQSSYLEIYFGKSTHSNFALIPFQINPVSLPLKA